GSSDTRPLLEQAGKILDALTGGRWVALDAEDDGTTRKLVVIRSDAERCGTGDLSEGTVDQAFLALRLAAVAELHAERIASGEPALPLVLDDVLMTFDEVRTQRALEVLAHLTPGLQVIVFTHHQFVGDAAAECEWATVSRLPEPSGIDSSVDGQQLRIRIQRDVLSEA
ncbi:MAG: ATP-binding protein, partial [Actinomycetota bacterium]